MGGLIRTHLEADVVAKAHLEQSLGNAAVAHRAGRCTMPSSIMSSTIL